MEQSLPVSLAYTLTRTGGLIADLEIAWLVGSDPQGAILLVDQISGTIPAQHISELVSLATGLIALEFWKVLLKCALEPYMGN